MDIVREFLHEGGKCRPGCYVDTTVDLEVEKVGALKYMVFVPMEPLVQKRQVRPVGGCWCGGQVRYRGDGLSSGGGGPVGGGSVGLY